MLFPKCDVKEHLKNIGLERNDVVMIHGDAGVAAQYIFGEHADPVSTFIEQIVSYFSEGTVIVPTFTYSATRGEVFCPKKSPSEVGLFSEKFRLMNGVYRSNHPIFSVSAIGTDAEYFSNSSLQDCFGPKTLFDKLYKKGSKLVTIGCSLDRVTFAHYVEQKTNVSYRYFKGFQARIEDKNIEDFEVNYFVRDVNLDTALDLSYLERQAIDKGLLLKKPFGRFLSRTISARDFFDIASALIKQDEYSLIKERNRN